MKKKNNYFYDSFTNLMDYALEAMSILTKGLEDFRNINLLEFKNNVHKVEHEADVLKHEYEEKLAKEFITPIDREDIFVLYDNIDDLIDSIDEVSYKLYLRNYALLPNNLNIMIEKSFEAIKSLKEIFVNFRNIDKKSIMDPLINKVIVIEEEMDKIYEENVHDLYVESNDYDKNRTFEKVYSYFEYITDKCRDVCKTILIIMYKNL
ncbi:MAG: DUF47 family protein [Mollicutes bacterium]|nr:DUF47 family protein [Mollicutes bacterium]MDD7263457.1 DUF47 family protein [bacterium]MDY4979266.1 DUF47 family protein [Candidatus Onthovivens sp.]